MGGAQTTQGQKGQGETVVFLEAEESRDPVEKAVGRRSCGCKWCGANPGREQERNPGPLLWPSHPLLVPSIGQIQQGADAGVQGAPLVHPLGHPSWFRSGQRVENG